MIDVTMFRNLGLVFLLAVLCAACREPADAVVEHPPLSVSELECVPQPVGFGSCRVALEEFLRNQPDGIVQVVPASDDPDQTRRLFVVHTRYPGKWSAGVDFRVSDARRASKELRAIEGVLFVPLRVGGFDEPLLLVPGGRARYSASSRDPLLREEPVTPAPDHPARVRIAPDRWRLADRVAFMKDPLRAIDDTRGLQLYLNRARTSSWLCGRERESWLHVLDAQLRGGHGNDYPCKTIDSPIGPMTVCSNSHTDVEPANQHTYVFHETALVAVGVGGTHPSVEDVITKISTETRCF